MQLNRKLSGVSHLSKSFSDVVIAHSLVIRIMKKSDAIEIARATHEVELNRANTHFSNVNKSKSVWWIEVPLRKLDDHESINLVVEKSEKVTLLQVPTKFFKDNFDGFKIRQSKQVLCLELDIDTFENRVGSARHNFKSFIR